MSDETRLPTCKALILCDRVIVDATTRHETYVNCFEKLRFHTFPHRLNHLIVVAHIEGGKGVYEFGIRIVRGATGEVAGEDMGRPIQIDYLADVGILTFNLYGVNLEEAGHYDAVFVANGEEIMRRSLNVVQLPAVHQELQVA